VAINLILTYRGLMYGEFAHITCALLITIGFISSLITKGISRNFLRILVLGSLLLMLLNDYPEVDMIILFRKAIPYLLTYFIVTISSGILKDRYELYQKRLVELVELLNEKNAKISVQHGALLKSYEQLASLNENLEEVVRVKTFRIEQKNAKLSEIAFANAHRVRGPLARILGLLHLMELDPHKKENYIGKVHREAIEMDDIVRLLGRDIEKNISER
jgi:signal transduction histidine kinase